MSGFSQLNPVPVLNGGTGGTTSTGSGAVVLATSPTLITPVLGAATATTLNGYFLNTTTGTSGFTFGANSALTLAAGKTFTCNNTLTLTGTDGITASLGAVGQVPGIATSTAASAGNVGEVITSDIPFGSAVSLTTSTDANITSITLTAGDWDVRGAITFTPGASTTNTYLRSSLSTTSATHDGTLGRACAIAYPSGTVIGASGFSGQIAPKVFTVTSGTTVVYLTARADFAVSTMVAYGNLTARRVR